MSVPDPPPIFGGRYQIVRHVARGGMAQVYLARDLLLDRPVALKVLFPELSVDEAFVERFRREAQAAANLSHPNIVSIFDWGQGDRTYYIVMEYVDGETLSARIRREPLTAEAAAGIAIPTANALSFAHKHGVIHRDVKPGNVLIDNSGHVKVADFGIARAGATESITQAGAVMGTATYFSPEQAQGHSVDARSDVYSLGVVLYEMVAGKPPFQGDNPVAIAYKHVGEAPPSLRDVNPIVPAGYEAIVRKAMAKSPADRYQTADALRIDLQRFLASRSGDDTIVVSRAAAGSRSVGAADATTAMAGATSVMRSAGGRSASDRSSGAAAVGRRLEATPAPAYADADDETGPIRIVRRSRRRLYGALLILLVALLVVLGFFIGRNLGYFGGVKTLTVPDVSGQAAGTARSTLRADGFTDISEPTMPSPTVAAGRVIATVPAPGSREKADSPIKLEVSAGPAPVPVPRVAGEPQSSALATLKDDGFSTNVTDQRSTSIRSGDVIRTSPIGGTLLAPGTKIQVVVSSGLPQIGIPGVAGQSPAVLAVTLNNLGFTVQQKNQASSTVPNGDVIQTSPAATTTAPYGSTVTIFVSTGPPTVKLPPLIGKTEVQASHTFIALGLVAHFTKQPVDSPAQNGLVQSTTPLVGMSVVKGSTVQVFIGTYTAPTTTTSTTTTVSTSTVPTTTSTTTSTTVGLGFGEAKVAVSPTRRPPRRR